MIDDLRVLAEDILKYDDPDTHEQKLAHGYLALLSEKEDTERDRDEIWCRALGAALSTYEVERVLKWFNRIRPDAPVEGSGEESVNEIDLRAMRRVCAVARYITESNPAGWTDNEVTNPELLVALRSFRDALRTLEGREEKP